MHSASVPITVAEKAGARRRTRMAYRTLRAVSSMSDKPFASRHSSFVPSTLPNSIRARRRASPAATPAIMRSFSNASMWKRNSSSISRSIRFRPNISYLLRDSPEDIRHRGRKQRPLLGFLLQPALARRAQAIILGSPVVFGNAPLGLDQSRALEPVERRIKRTLFDL